MYLAASPIRFNTPNRTNDIDALVSSIDEAQMYVFCKNRGGKKKKEKRETLQVKKRIPFSWNK